MYIILLRQVDVTVRSGFTWLWIGRLSDRREAMQFARRNCRRGRVRVRKIRH